MKVFLDACAIIYWVEIKEPQYARFASKLNDLRKLHGNFQFAASQLSLLECQVKPLRDKNKDVLNRYEQFFNAKDLHLVPISFEIIREATLLRAEKNFATPDALQAASALSIPDDIIFITGDPVFKKIPHLQLLMI
jgi:predicted nucleic acid-binding protein